MQTKEKTALITGGTHGIGAAIALDLAAAGADVAIVARNLDEAAQSVKSKVEALRRKCELIQGDMTKADDCVDVVGTTIEKFGQLDVLIHNAGGPSPGRLEEISATQWLETMNLHVNALFYLCQAAVPHIKERGEGAIITVGSTAGTLGVEGALAYATAKGAVPHFTRCLAREVADAMIRVNCVAPGVIRTRFHDDMTEERKQLNVTQRIPLKAEGTPQQVAEAVRLLITNDYITGETLMVDGGLTCRIC